LTVAEKQYSDTEEFNQLHLRLVPIAFTLGKLPLTTDKAWAERRQAILRLEFDAHCSVHHPSLGLFNVEDPGLVRSEVEE
jgi:hypothetical protein